MTKALTGKNRSAIDIDFSLAIYNATGKYFIGRDVIDCCSDQIRRIYYGALPFRQLPPRPIARLLGRLQHIQTLGRTGVSGRHLPPRPRDRTPILHLDPFTVASTQLRAVDAVLCHDIGPVTHPELFAPEISAAYLAIYEQIADIGPHLIFVSHASRVAFETAWPNARPRSVRVIYPAIRQEVAAGSKAVAALLDGPFLLTVGSLGDRKNQARSIEAYGRSRLAERGIRYVLCGGAEPGFDHVAEVAAATPGVVRLPYLSDEELAWLYGNATGFVLMSLLEGFGIPVAEAIARNLVPLVSRGGVLAEVAGEGAIEADPRDIDEIAAAMCQLAALTYEERTARLDMLHLAIRRFQPNDFVSAWRTALSDIGWGALDSPQAQIQK